MFEFPYSLLRQRFQRFPSDSVHPAYRHKGTCRLRFDLTRNKDRIPGLFQAASQFFLCDRPGFRSFHDFTRDRHGILSVRSSQAQCFSGHRLQEKIHRHCPALHRFRFFQLIHSRLAEYDIPAFGLHVRPQPQDSRLPGLQVRSGINQADLLMCSPQ